MNRRAVMVFLFVAAAVAAAIVVWQKAAQNSALPRVDDRAAKHSERPADPLFENVTESVGLRFIHDPGSINLYQVPQVTGSGCAMFDFDQDGDIDVLFVNQAGGAGFVGVSAAVKQNAGGPTNRLYRQEPDGTFVDVTPGSGLDVTDVGLGVAVGDVNNDGFPDLYLSCYGPDRLFLNRCDGTFADITTAAGIDNLLWGTSCVFVDYDRDGWLDLFVANYVDYHTTRRCADPNGQREFCNPKTFTGTPHKLFRNESGALAMQKTAAGESADARVRFRDVSLESGIARKSGPGLGVVAADFDGDHWPDFFVANDGAANFLWMNQHDGTFTEEAVLRGVAYDLAGHAQANMGIALGDVDGDGRFDLLVTHFQGEMNALYLNKTAAGFEESAGAVGLGEPGLHYTKWGTAFFDVDHDGHLDLAIANGRVKRAESDVPAATRNARRVPAATDWNSYAEPNQLFLNDGAGRFIERGSTEPFCAERDVFRALAVGDIDNDGDLDVLVTSVAGPARLFRNVAPKRGHWLLVRAIEPALGGRDAYGAQVTVTAGERRWVRLVSPAFSYLSSNDPRVHFGLGNSERFDHLSVIWADGVEEVFSGGNGDRHIVVRRGEGRPP